MRRSLRVFTLAVLLSASYSAGDFYIAGPRTKHWFILSPQVGGAWAPDGGFVAGSTASFYPLQDGGPGFGAGAYAYGGRFQAEALAKLSLFGFVGFSAGAAWQDGHLGPTCDLWANALFAGLRLKATQRPHGYSFALLTFVPLWYLNDL